MSDKELKEMLAQLIEAQKKTDEQLRKTDEQLRKTDEQLKKTDEQLRKTDEQLRKDSEEFSKRIKKLEELVGNIGNNQGDVAEEFFVNSLKESLKIANINFDYLLKNVGLNTKNIKDEFDIILVNGESVALIEVKYKVHPSILEQLPKKIEHFKMLPQYKGYKVYAGIAGFYIPDDVIKEALKKGYFVLQRKGDIIQTFTDNLKAA